MVKGGKMKILILAGGSGSRLWPLSRKHYPKQFIKLMDRNFSLFQETFLKCLQLTSADEIYVVTNQKYEFLVMGSIQELGYDYSPNQIILEPEAKNTLPAILFSVIELTKNEEDDFLVLPSDQLIKNNEIFSMEILKGQKYIKENIVIYGIKPNKPHTGYGYIEKGDIFDEGYKVTTFHEKPTLEMATEYLAKGYLWNSGIFMFSSKFFKEKVKETNEEIYQIFSSEASKETKYERVKNISIDHGLIEKIQALIVVPTNFNWNDLGSFDAFYDVLDVDREGNINHGDIITIDSHNNLIYAEKDKLIATVGIEDLIIIEKKDAILICKKDHSQGVKAIVKRLETENDPRKDYHIEDYRPWGKYEVLDEKRNTYKIKKITVLPGKRLSYQLHHHRSEHWVIIKGMAKVTIDDKVTFVRSGESIFMKEGQKHRLENPGKINLEIIEVQMGEYVEEDDIVRFQDDYKRPLGNKI